MFIKYIDISSLHGESININLTGHKTVRQGKELKTYSERYYRVGPDLSFLMLRWVKCTCLSPSRHEVG